MHDTKPGVIITNCQTTFLRLVPVSWPDGISITNSEGERVGELCGEATKIREELTLSMYDTSTNVEFCALSLSGHDQQIYSRKQEVAKNFIDADGNSLTMLPVVNVLMIDRVEAGMARRRALGWIFLMDWINLHREWKMIILE